ncbi:MAG: GNAT family N-acetyltransferase [Symbiobacteriia bacterium]
MLVGEKTQLRPLERGDLPQWQQWMNDPEVMYWASGGYPDATLFSLGVLEKLLERDEGTSNQARYAVNDPSLK